jgi:hypothetical protein
MKPGRIDSDGANGCAQELWGELIGIEDRTDQERIFTIYKHSGSLLILSDTGCELLAGPDYGLSKTRIFQKVMDQFRVPDLRSKPSFCGQPGLGNAPGPIF